MAVGGGGWGAMVKSMGFSLHGRLELNPVLPVTSNVIWVNLLKSVPVKSSLKLE